MGAARKLRGKQAMSSSGSITAWIGQLQAGEESALGKLHGRYWSWFVAVARRKLKGARLHAADEEDIAQQAFWSFYRRFKAGGVPRLSNRHEFLALVTTIIACKAVNQIQAEVGVQKRGRGKEHSESVLVSLADPQGQGDLDQFANGTRTPQEEAILKDTYRYFVEGLPAKLRSFAELYLADFTHKEIAQELDCGLRSVERKIHLILARWQEMAQKNVNNPLAG